MVNKDKQLILSVVVPVTKMTGKLANLESWLHEIPENELEVWLIHDVKDILTSSELSNLVSRINCETLHLVEGVYNSPGLTRNVGLEKSTGKWIAFWDSDDLPQIRNVMDAIRDSQTKSEILVGGYQKISNLAETSVQNYYSNDCDNVAMEPSLWRMIIKKEVIGNVRFRDFMMAEDQVFLSELRFSSRSISYPSNLFYKYFINVEGQLTGNKTAVLDLARTLEFLTLELWKLKRNDFRFTSLLVANQLFSTITRGSIIWRLGIYGKVWRVVLKFQFLQKANFLYFIIIAFLNRMKGSLSG